MTGQEFLDELLARTKAARIEISKVQLGYKLICMYPVGDQLLYNEICIAEKALQYAIPDADTAFLRIAEYAGKRVTAEMERLACGGSSGS